MLTDKELWKKCETNKPITCEDLGLPSWRSNTDGFVYECGGFTFYKTSNGYVHCDGKPATRFKQWFYDLR